MSSPQDSPPYLDQLQARLGARWISIEKARADTAVWRANLSREFSQHGSPDTSLVVFGSVARGEVTSGSDLDWILLVDGQSFPQHKAQEQEIARRVQSGPWPPPGRSGVFGRMVGSHDLVHNIGGEDDLNSNPTRRVLLLLESYPVGSFGNLSLPRVWPTYSAANWTAQPPKRAFS
jgi:hypothetical protein